MRMGLGCMMRKRNVLGALAFALALAGCGPNAPFVADTARIGPGGPQAFNPISTATYQAQWAFALPSRTRGQPIEAARAAANLDYIAGQINTSPRFANVSAVTQQQLLQGREEVRQALGVAPGAKSQQIVDRLADAARALAAGDEAGAKQALGPPVFTPGGAAVLARLTDLPYLTMANVSTQRAAAELFQTGGPLLAP